MSNAEQKVYDKLGRIVNAVNSKTSIILTDESRRQLAKDIVSVLQPTHQAEAKPDHFQQAPKMIPVDGELRANILKQGLVFKGSVTFSGKSYSNGTASVGMKSQDVVEIGIDDLMAIVSAHLQAAVRLDEARTWATLVKREEMSKFICDGCGLKLNMGEECYYCGYKKSKELQTV